MKGPRFLSQKSQKKMDLVIRQNREKIRNFKQIAFHHLIGATFKQVVVEDQVCVFFAGVVLCDMWDLHSPTRD